MTEPLVFDVTAATFEDAVLARSRHVPVLVDFWAAWCGPCRMLGPVLEQVATELGGKFVVAKVDTEASPELGQRFSVSSIPACKLFVDGEVVGEFVGAISGSQVRRFVESHLPSEADKLATSAKQSLEAGDRQRARVGFDRALALDAKQPDAHLGLAKLALHDRSAAEALAHLDAIEPGSDAWIAADAVRAATDFVAVAAAVGGEAGARSRLASDPNDLEAIHGLGCALALDARWEEALKTLLRGVMRNNKHRDGATRKAMVTIFDLIGRHHELSDTYVRQLQIYT